MSTITTFPPTGGYTAIVPIDHYQGSNLRYILVNVLRRAIRPEFREAVTSPPLQTPDLVLLVCWLGGTAVCLTVQLVVERRRAPFPPAPFQQWRWVRDTRRINEEESERTPLVRPEPEDGYDVDAADTPSAEPVVPVVGRSLIPRAC